MNKRYTIKQEVKSELVSGRSNAILSDALGVSPGYMCKVLSGKNSCDKATAIAMMYLLENYAKVEQELEKYFTLEK